MGVYNGYNNYGNLVAFVAKNMTNIMDKQGVPILFHVFRVADACRRDGLSENSIQAALLHDIVEDVKHIELHHIIDLGVGANVVEAVNALTRREDELYFDYIHRLSFNYIATQVKIRDVLDNMDMSRYSGEDSMYHRYAKTIGILREVLK